MKSVQIRFYFWSVFFCIQSEYRKIRTRKNSVFGHFSHSDRNSLIARSIQNPIKHQKRWMVISGWMQCKKDSSQGSDAVLSLSDFYHYFVVYRSIIPTCKMYDIFTINISNIYEQWAIIIYCCIFFIRTSILKLPKWNYFSAF